VVPSITCRTRLSRRPHPGPRVINKAGAVFAGAGTLVRVFIGRILFAVDDEEGAVGRIEGREEVGDGNDAQGHTGVANGDGSECAVVSAITERVRSHRKCT